jgi:hypothetical protein
LLLVRPLPIVDLEYVRVSLQEEPDVGMTDAIAHGLGASAGLESSCVRVSKVVGCEWNSDLEIWVVTHRLSCVFQLLRCWVAQCFRG